MCIAKALMINSKRAFKEDKNIQNDTGELLIE